MLQCHGVIVTGQKRFALHLRSKNMMGERSQMNPEAIGKFISEERKAKGLTQKELGEALGLSDKAVSK